MLPTLIGPKFYKAGKAAKNKSVNEEKETADSKVDNLEEYQASITSIKKNNKKIDASSNSIKNKHEIVDKV